MNLEQLASKLGDQLIAWYGVRREEVRFVFSPYRICPLGAHIDHQLGRVTAMALDRGILLAFAPSKLAELRVRSLDFHGEVAFSFGDVGPPRQGDWGNYPRGAVLALQKDFALNYGYFGATAGRSAEGGLSSSAAVGVAYLKALEQVNGLEVTTEKNIDLVQQIENTYLGLRIGILDQSAILLSRANMLTVIDCHDVSSSLISRAEHAPDFDILIAASGLRESLVSTDYNQRVAECEHAARQLLEAAGRPETPAHLRNVTPHQYRQFRTALEGPPARRAAHFFSEMKRVDQGIEAWKQGDLMTFGKLITESGASSIRNYECGAPPLVDLYHILCDTPGVYGARFSGAGFRGCCLALVEPESADAAAHSVQEHFRRRHPILAADSWTMICRPGDGVRFL